MATLSALIAFLAIFGLLNVQHVEAQYQVEALDINTYLVVTNMASSLHTSNPNIPGLTCAENSLDAAAASYISTISEPGYTEKDPTVAAASPQYKNELAAFQQLVSDANAPGSGVSADAASTVQSQIGSLQALGVTASATATTATPPTASTSSNQNTVNVLNDMQAVLATQDQSDPNIKAAEACIAEAIAYFAPPTTTVTTTTTPTTTTTSTTTSTSTTTTKPTTTTTPTTTTIATTTSSERPATSMPGQCPNVGKTAAECNAIWPFGCFWGFLGLWNSGVCPGGVAPISCSSLLWAPSCCCVIPDTTTAAPTTTTATTTTKPTTTTTSTTTTTKPTTTTTSTTTTPKPTTTTTTTTKATTTTTTKPTTTTTTTTTTPKPTTTTITTTSSERPATSMPGQCPNIYSSAAACTAIWPLGCFWGFLGIFNSGVCPTGYTQISCSSLLWAPSCCCVPS